jgi:hypothetical protein
VKKIISARFFLVFIIWIACQLLLSDGLTGKSAIKRLTFSNNNRVIFSSISGNGLYAIYTLDIISGTGSKKSLRRIELNTGKEVEIFTEGETKTGGLPGRGELLLGSKPPLLNGDGSRAFFLLSMGNPDNLIDHVLAIANPGRPEIETLQFRMAALEGEDIKAAGFRSANWERISNFAVSTDGTRIALALKGHLGPLRYGNCSGIILLDLKAKKQRTILTPEFKNEGWTWSSFPSNPLLGGGWAFALSGNGEKVLFGARSSEDKTDYDLYVADWNSGNIKKITDFSDRWFSLADMDFDGKEAVFYYNGEKKQGIGTYRINTDGSEMRILMSPSQPRIELVGMAGNGSLIYYKNVYQGMVLDLKKGEESILFDERVPGYVRGVIPMDFPQVPAFCTPKIASLNGDRILLAGPPLDRQSFELYLLSVDLPGIKR